MFEMQERKKKDTFTGKRLITTKKNILSVFIFFLIY